MHGGSIIRHLDKQLLFQWHYRAQVIGDKKLAIKHQYPLLFIQNHFTNLLNSILENQIIWGPNADVKRFLEEHVTGNKAAQLTFMEIFHVNQNVAKNLLSKNPYFNLIPKKKVMDNYQALKSAGLNTSLLLDNISLLSEDTQKLQRKLNIVERFTNDINQGIPFLYHNTSTLNAFAKSNVLSTKEFLMHNNLEYFDTQFGIKSRELYHLLAKYIHYIVQDSESTLEKLKLLLDYGVNVNSLISSKWPIYCSYKKMKTRLEQFSKSKLLSPPKPWIFTCNEAYFDSKVVENALKLKKIDAYTEIVDLLTEKSGYGKALIEYKMKNFMSFDSLDFNEVKEVTTTIIENGYTYHDLIWSLKIITLKKDVIKKRFYELELRKHKAPFLNILLLPDEVFVKYVNSV